MKGMPSSGSLPFFNRTPVGLIALRAVGTLELGTLGARDTLGSCQFF